MKTFQIILLAINLLMCLRITQAQNTKIDSVFWDNGNVSVLSELDRVWIIQKKGGTIKEARIVEILKEKGVLVYEKERCLHNLSIGNISRIEPGKYPLSTMSFQADNTPVIKNIYKNMDQFIEPDDFKHISKKKTEQCKPSSEPTSITDSKVAAVKSISTMVCDTLIDEEGIVTPIKIISLESKIINYKKTNNPNGPIYVKPFSEAVITKYEYSTTINLYKKP